MRTRPSPSLSTRPTSTSSRITRLTRERGRPAASWLASRQRKGPLILPPPAGAASPRRPAGVCTRGTCGGLSRIDRREGCGCSLCRPSAPPEQRTRYSLGRRLRWHCRCRRARRRRARRRSARRGDERAGRSRAGAARARHRRDRRASAAELRRTQPRSVPTAPAVCQSGDSAPATLQPPGGVAAGE
jgi:hypothetical protein